MYFNKKNKRVGKLFEGPFKSSWVDNEQYSKYIFSYIHLNPVKLIDPNWHRKGLKDVEGVVNFLNNYRWSSYKDYMKEGRSENAIISVVDFPDYFGNQRIFSKEIFEWLSLPSSNPKASPEEKNNGKNKEFLYYRSY
jgi:putative transposase